MILFDIEFLYKEKKVIGHVWELEDSPKQWHITVDAQEKIEYIKGIYKVFYNENEKEYIYEEYPQFDLVDKTFMKSLLESLIKYLQKNGWNSISV
jgi:hypothetical protein